jgi:DNA-binding transcriptional regulator GbsR (MarR family)
MRHEHLNAEIEIRAIEKRLVEMIANLGYFKGRSRRTSQILAYLTIRNRVKQKTLREATGYSLGTVSNTLKELRELGLVRESREPGGRERLYELVVPLSQHLGHYSTAMNQYIHEWNEFLEQLDNELQKNHIAKKKGAKEIRNFINKLRVVLSVTANAMHRLQLTKPETPLEVADK